MKSFKLTLLILFLISSSLSDTYNFIDNKNLNLTTNTLTYDKTNPSNINLLNSNSIMFESLDKSKGDNAEKKFGTYRHIDDLKTNEFNPLDPLEPLNILVDIENGKVREGSWKIKTANKIKILNYKKELNKAQVDNITRTIKKIPANSKENIEIHKNIDGNIIFKATSPGKVLGSKAEYIKTIDKNGNTINRL